LRLVVLVVPRAVLLSLCRDLPSRIVANILWFIIVLPSGAKIKRPRFIATGQGFYRFLEDIGGG